MKTTFTCTLSLTLLLLSGLTALADSTTKPTEGTPIREIPVSSFTFTETGLATLTAGSASKPAEITSEKDAATYLDKDNIAKLAKLCDFTKQKVLIFAWQGSGQDKLSYTVAESSPEQITFTLKHGMTRDLRPHLYIYLLRNDVTWTPPNNK